MSIILDGTSGITSPGGDTAAVSVATPILKSPSSLTFQINGSTTAMLINTNGSMGATGTADTTFTNSPFTLSMASTNGYAAGVGSGILFNAVYNSAGSPAGVAAISGVKETATDGNYAGALTFMTRANGSGGGNQERMRINSNGNIVLQGGTATASGIGVTFPATQSGSSDANCLDDYEEGTFTPTIAFANAGTAVTYTTQVGWYTKVGNIVSIQVLIQVANKGTGTGLTFVNGLPFTPPAAALYSGGAVGYAANFTAAGPGSCYLDPGVPRVVLYDPYTQGYTTDTNFTNTSIFALQVTYRTNT